MLLLALYAFVATPVQLWHHHNTAQSIHPQTGEYMLLAADDDAESESGCTVCSHKYTPYATIDIVAIEPLTPMPAVQQHYWHAKATQCCLLAASNKGPPAIFC